MKKVILILSCVMLVSGMGSEAYGNLGDTGADLIYTPVAPCRIIDTRASGAGGAIPGNGTRNFVVAGAAGFDSQGGHAGGCAIPEDATSVMINFIAVNPSTGGHLRAWPYGGSMPNASIVNFVPGFNIANGLIQPICDTGTTTCSFDLTIYAASDVNVVADVTGYFRRFPTEELPGGSLPSDSLPNPLDGTSSAGISANYSRGDHKHGIAPGAITSPMIVDGAVTTSKIGSGQVTGTHILDGTIMDTEISNSAAISGSKLASNGSVVKSLVPGANISVVNNNNGSWTVGATVPGDITAVYAGPGLTGTTMSGDAMLFVDFGGTGSVNTVSRSDHNHNADYVNVTGDSMSGATPVAVLSVTNTGTGDGVSVEASGWGVRSSASGTSGWGVYGSAAGTEGRGVVGVAGNNAGVENYGGYFTARGTSGRGVYGVASNAGDVTNYGGYFEASGTYGWAVYGYANNTGTGTNYGGYFAAAGTGGRGVSGTASGTHGKGVYGNASNSETVENYGGYFEAAGGSGRGVYGYASGNSGRGVYGEATSTDGYGGYFYNGSGSSWTRGVAVAGFSGSGSSTDTHPSGWSFLKAGGEFAGPNGVIGAASSDSTLGVGVLGLARSGDTSRAIYAIKPGGGDFAGLFLGNVHVDGNLSASGTKPFKMDHPVDPANKYLMHYAIESPTVQNMYNGTIILDAYGEAIVQLPDYFEAVNTEEFTYTLTPIGASMPGLHVAEEVQNSQFKISGGMGGKKVSWVLIGQRNDPWVKDHPAKDVVDKPKEEAGTYLYPKGHGQPESLSLTSVHMQKQRKPWEKR